MLGFLYGWLRGVVPAALISPQPTIDVQNKYDEFKAEVGRLNGGGAAGNPTHEEIREVMYEICGACGWWDWRGTRSGLEEFPIVPLSRA